MINGMHTTAGSLALCDLTAKEDAYIVTKLRQAGALILGKTNLSEFAYFMSTKGMPSGYSSRSGQVIHPWSPGYDPSGSSSGSAVAAAARFVPYTIGTETDGSLMSPSISSAVVSIKPTVCLVSRSGILPISRIQDTAGPMCTSVEDAAIVLQVLAGKDPDDRATLICKAENYTEALTENCAGKRIGIFRRDLCLCDEEALDKAKEILEKAGAEVLEITMEETKLSEFECLKHEFKYYLNQYLDTHTSKCRSLSDIIAFNNEHSEQCLKYGQDLLTDSDKTDGRLVDSEYMRKRAELFARSRQLLDGTLDTDHLDCLLSAGKRPASNLAPISGNPCMTIPAIVPDENSYEPVSYYLMARAFHESVLIQISYTLEQALKLDCRPSWTKENICF